jgi:hypothetical protein
LVLWIPTPLSWGILFLQLHLHFLSSYKKHPLGSPIQKLLKLNLTFPSSHHPLPLFLCSTS